jgi:hypothetical protein
MRLGLARAEHKKGFDEQVIKPLLIAVVKRFNSLFVDQSIACSGSLKV